MYPVSGRDASYECHLVMCLFMIQTACDLVIYPVSFSGINFFK